MQGGGWQPPGGGGSGGYGPAGYGPSGYPPQAAYRSGAPPMMPQYGTYELNPYENSIVEKTASRAKLWGIISTTIGALQIMGSCGVFANPLLATYLPAGIVAIVVGITFMGVGNSLKAVVTTQGNDLMHLMQALQKMSTAFIIEIVCAIIGFVMAVISILVVMFVLVVSS